jgi:hypothetical protein
MSHVDLEDPVDSDEEIVSDHNCARSYQSEISEIQKTVYNFLM